MSKSQTTYLLEGQSGTVALASVPAGAQAPGPTSPGLGVRPVAAGETLPPAELHAAWRWNGANVPEVDLMAAKTAHAATLKVRAASLTAQVSQVALVALATGDTKKFAALGTAIAALQTAPDLTAITDPAALAKFEPAAFQAARTAAGK